MIKLIIFDLGKVILDFSRMDIAKGLAGCSTLIQYQNPDNILAYLFDTGYEIIIQYEEGRITSQEFFKHASEVFGLDMSYERFKSVWSEIFVENDGVADLIELLKKDFPLFLLSNTNELHFEYIKKQFPVVHKFDECILSYRIGKMKPHPDIYMEALNRGNASPEETIYIDDIGEYVAAAQDMGINAVEFKSVEQITNHIKEIIHERQTR
ncbi:MAG: HAD family phosphatase [Nitrospirae bacterium]|nr:HAD family phosphatase [Nitrospirota bacterium]